MAGQCVEEPTLALTPTPNTHTHLPFYPSTPLQAVAAEFRGKLRAADLDTLWTHFSSLQFGWASTELQVPVGAGGALPSLT